MLRTIIARSTQELEAMCSVWTRLTEADAYPFFQRFEANLLAARVFADRQMPFVVMSESDSGIAIIPACVERFRSRISLFGEELFDYRGVLMVGDRAVLQKCWSTLADFASSHDLGFAFHALREAEQQTFNTCGLSTLPFTSAPFCLASQRSEFHHPRLAAKLRRFERLGVSVVTHDGKEAPLIREILAHKSHETNSLFVDPNRIEMVCAMAETFGSECEIFSLQTASSLLAAIITFRDRRWRRFYTTYYDKTWAKLSPGFTLLHEVMRQSLEEGLDCDLMTGSQPYKMRLANGAAPLFRVEMSAEEFRVSGRQLLQMA